MNHRNCKWQRNIRYEQATEVFLQERRYKGCGQRDQVRTVIVKKSKAGVKVSVVNLLSGELASGLFLSESPTDQECVSNDGSIFTISQDNTINVLCSNKSLMTEC